jgi:hypothetical protein
MHKIYLLIIEFFHIIMRAYVQSIYLYIKNLKKVFLKNNLLIELLTNVFDSEMIKACRNKTIIKLI